MESHLNKKLLSYIAPGKVFVFSTTYCPYCVKAKNLLKENEIKYDTVEVDSNADLRDDEDFLQALEKHSKISTYPKVYIGMNCIGGFTDLSKLFTTMMLFSLLRKERISFKDEHKYNSKY
jgi:glutaredoxin